MAAIALAGCSSSSTHSAAVGPTSTTRSATGDGGCSARTSTMLKAVTATPTVNYAALPKALTATTSGKGAVWYVSDTAVGVLEELGDGMTNAGKVAGVSVKQYNSNGSAASAVQGIQSAVSQGASAIVISAIQTATIVPGLQAAQKAHIPVISIFEAAEGPAAGAVVARVEDNADFEAEGWAAWALQATNCQAHVGFIYAQAYSNNVVSLASLKKYVGEACSSCTVTAAAENLETETTSVGPLAATMVERNPDLNVVVASDPDQIPYVAPAIKTAAGARKVLLTTESGDSQADSLFASSSSSLDSEMYIAPYDFMGWQAMDTVLRVFGGATPASDVEIPQRLVLKADAGKSDPIASVVNYQHKYTAAWGAAK